MNDTRMTWLAIYSQAPAETIIIQQGELKTDVNSTLSIFCKNLGAPQYIEQPQKQLFRNLPPHGTSTKENHDKTILYQIQNRNSLHSIKKKIHKFHVSKVDEYVIFPGWNNPRWCVPIHRSLNSGKMSRMINPSRWTAKAVVLIFRILKTLHLERYLFTSRVIIAHNNKTSLSNFFGILGPNIKTGIVYTGSFGPLQKIIIELLNKDDQVFAYAKLGLHQYSQKAILREEQALTALTSLHLRTLQVPEIIPCNLPAHLENKAIIIKTLHGGKPVTSLSQSIINGLIELAKVSNSKEINLASYIDQKINALKKIDCLQLGEKLNQVQSSLIRILKSLLLQTSKTEKIPMALSHGDFTRWNIQADQYNVFAIDWEECATRPVGHDMLTFLLAEKLILEGLSPQETSTFFVRLSTEQSSLTINKYFLETTPSTTDTKIFFILFFTEIARYNLWHTHHHTNNRYPPKKSLLNYIYTAEIACRRLTELPNRP